MSADGTFAEDRSALPLPGARRAFDKWKGDDQTPIGARLRKAGTYVTALASARFYLRGATSVGEGVRTIGHPRVRNEGILVLGRDCVLRSTTLPVELVVGPGARLVLGPGVIINAGASLGAVSSIELGARVLVGSYVTVNDSSYHEVYDRSTPPKPRPVIIEDDVWLGLKSTVLPGVRIGRGAIVVAHALVNKNVAPFTIVSGVPAQQVGELDPRKFVVRDG